MTGRVAGAVLAGVLAAGCGPAGRAPGEGLPFYDSPDLTPRWGLTTAHTVGDFALTTQTGEPITGADLDGRIHVASFFFARCDDLCPLLVSRLRAVQAALADHPAALLVSYSVAPAHDSVDVLARFGEEQGVDPARWKLVTGDPAVIYRLARESYFADDDRLDASRSPAELFLHTEKVLLVDRAGRLRGVYNGSMRFEIAKLLADVETLSREGA